jgi:F-type H+-transporting ATPase subunit delta
MTLPMGLRGPSADAGARLERQLAEAIAGLDSDRVAKLGSDLFGVSELLGTQPRLRRALTDPTTESDAKAGFVRSLFGGKVDDIVVELLSTAAAHRWTAVHDLADTLERLGAETTVRSADDARRVGDELFAVGRLLADHPDLRAALDDPARTDADKVALLRTLLADRTSSATQTSTGHAVTSGQHRNVGLALAAFQKVAADVEGERVATVRSARELSGPERERLASALSRQYHREVHLNVIVDERLIGGLRVEIGDDVIDGSVAGRLDDARRRLVG